MSRHPERTGVLSDRSSSLGWGAKDLCIAGNAGEQ